MTHNHANTWMFAEGRVSPHSDELHIVERYRRVDANTLEVEATVEDPKILTKPWTAPQQTLVPRSLRPDHVPAVFGLGNPGTSGPRSQAKFR
jgi:hypothetical protein